MAGRTISVDRNSLGSTRVMRTCGMMGEVVGKAAWICVRHHTSPRGVYEQYLDILKDLMNQPGAMRRDALEVPNLYLPANAKKLPDVSLSSDSIDPKKLDGIVIDDEDAETHRQVEQRRRPQAPRRQALQLWQRRSQRSLCLRRQRKRQV
jgi:hypothetical protein